jgi:hypothetical protein
MKQGKEIRIMNAQLRNDWLLFANYSHSKGTITLKLIFLPMLNTPVLPLE